MVSPRLLLMSPEPSSGKSSLLTAISLLCSDSPYGHIKSSVSAAAIVRSGRGDTGHEESWWGADLPPLFIDEVDKKYRSSETEDVRTTEILNSGFQPGAFFERMGGANNQRIDRFPIFGAVAMSGINTPAIPRALETRCLLIPMDKATQEERRRLAKFRRRHVMAEYLHLRNRLDEFGEWAAGKVDCDSVKFPEGLEARDEDLWEILLAIAAVVAGDDWPERAEAAMKWFGAERAEVTQESRGVTMLTDALSILKDRRGKAKPEDLRSALHNDEGMEWGDLHLTASQMKKTFKRYGIKPVPIRMGSNVSKGYKADQFETALLRHRCGLPDDGDKEGYTIDNENKDVTSVTELRPKEAPPKPAPKPAPTQPAREAFNRMLRCAKSLDIFCAAHHLVICPTTPRSVQEETRNDRVHPENHRRISEGRPVQLRRNGSFLWRA